VRVAIDESVRQNGSPDAISQRFNEDKDRNRGCFAAFRGTGRHKALGDARARAREFERNNIAGNKCARVCDRTALKIF